MRKAARAPGSTFMGVAMYLAGFYQPSLKLFNLQLNLFGYPHTVDKAIHWMTQFALPNAL